MNVQQEIEKNISNQPEQKRSDMRELHHLILQVSPGCKLWFFDGKNDDDKAITNPTIGYGLHTIKYANGTTRDFFQIGMSANKTGISISIIGIKDKAYLPQTFGETIGKASVTGYCIKLKTIKDINMDVLKDAIRYGFKVQHEKVS